MAHELLYHSTLGSSIMKKKMWFGNATDVEKHCCREIGGEKSFCKAIYAEIVFCKATDAAMVFCKANDGQRWRRLPPSTAA